MTSALTTRMSEAHEQASRALAPFALIGGWWYLPPAGATAVMKRIAIFAHYDRSNEVKRYIVHHVEQLAALCDRVDFVSTCEHLPEAERAKLAPYCSRILLKDNRGFDFSMWRHAIDDLDLGDYGELVLTNSSVYGPVAPLAPVFDAMGAAACDLWSITENFEHDWHLQSYFLVFKTNVLRSKAFAAFWQAVLPYRQKWQVIRSYELGLTQFFTDAGFRCRAYLPSSSLFPPWPVDLLYRGKRRNPTARHAARLLRLGAPYVKVELLGPNPTEVRLGPVYRALARTDYDRSLIEPYRRGLLPTLRAVLDRLGPGNDRG